MTAALTRNDVEQIIKDNIKPAIAEAMTEVMRSNAEIGEKRRKDGELVEGANGVIVDRSVQVLNDPEKGKGLAFARMVKALAAGQIEHKPAEDIARAWSKAGHRQYETVAEQISDAESKKRALSDLSLTSGGALVPPQMAAEIIELLYARTVAMKLGARTIEFPGALEMGRVNSGATVAYVGETSNIVPSQPGFGNLKMSRKKAAAIVPMANELLRNPAVGADVIVRDDLLAQLALRRDLSVLRGSGAEQQPKGITNAIVAANKNASAGTSLANKVSDLITLIRLVSESNVPMLSPGFAFSPRTRWSLMSTLDSQGKFVFKDEMAAGTLFGFAFADTTQIPNNLSGSNSEIYFGAWNDLIIGFDSTTPLMVEVFPNGTYYDGSALVSGVSSDQSVIRALEGHDVLLRHNNTFAMTTGVAWTT